MLSSEIFKISLESISKINKYKLVINLFNAF